MPLRLEGELAFSVDGPGGATTGTARGDGALLSVRADDPVVAWDALAGAAPRGTRALAALADHLAEQGLSVRVTGPAGRLATVGAAADSAVGRAVTGSRRVQPGSPRALRPLLLAQVRARARRSRSVLLGVVGAGALAAWRRRTRH